MSSLEPPPSLKAGRLAIFLLPFAVGVFFVFLSLMPFGFALGIGVNPAFALMPIYFWAVQRPELMPPPAVLFFGLLVDLMSGGPFGLYGFVYLVTYAVVMSQRQLFAGKRAAILAGGFVLAMGFAAVLSWILASIYMGTFTAVGPVAIQALISVAIFPLFVSLFERLHNWSMAQG